MVIEIQTVIYKLILFEILNFRYVLNTYIQFKLYIKKYNEVNELNLEKTFNYLVNKIKLFI